MVLDVADVRRQFLGLDGDEVLFDNAGGSQVLRSVAERVAGWYVDSNVQLGASYARSKFASERMSQANDALADFVGAASAAEIVVGPSTTQLVANLAQSLVQRLMPGDEIVVSMADHAANVSPWLALAQRGIVIKRWPVHPESGLLDGEALDALLNSRTRVVCFTHCSNITGAIEPAADWVRRIHTAGALAMVDGVAFAPHRQVDVQAIGADFYVISLYKTFGPHLALMHIAREVFSELPGINHPFIGIDELPYKLQPGNANYELSWAAAAIPEYLSRLGSGSTASAWSAIEAHESALLSRLIDGLRALPGVRIVGPCTADPTQRVSLLGFCATGRAPCDIVAAADVAGIGIRHGHFYSPWLVESLGLATAGGIVRVSMAHYNALDEVDQLLRVLSSVLARV